MKSKGRIVLTWALIILLLLVCLSLARRWVLRAYVNSVPTSAFLYPKPPRLPEVVDETMQDLLKRYERVLQAKAPHVLASLRPGLSSEEIDALETKYNTPFTDDLRALYRWHDGSNSNTDSFITIHRFVPLEEALQTRDAMKAEANAMRGFQREFDSAISGHTESWITIFDDGCGDGYYYDPKRRDTGGYFFYNFKEDGEFIFFPSLKNFMAGVHECYDLGIYTVGPDGTLDEDVNRSMPIWERYSATNPR